MWSVLNSYPSSVTLSRSIFLSANRPILMAAMPFSIIAATCIMCVIAAIVKCVADMYVLLIILLVALPFGTAIACGALMQWAGNTISGWSSIGGLALGIYFFHKCMEVLAAA
jgi:hypothetical protein